MSRICFVCLFSSLVFPPKMSTCKFEFFGSTLMMAGTQKAPVLPLPFFDWKIKSLSGCVVIAGIAAPYIREGFVYMRGGFVRLAMSASGTLISSQLFFEWRSFLIFLCSSVRMP